MEGSIEGPPSARMLAGWCRVFQPVDRDLNDGNVDEAGERQDGGGAGAAGGSSKRAQQGHVAEIEEETGSAPR